MTGRWDLEAELPHLDLILLSQSEAAAISGIPAGDVSDGATAAAAHWFLDRGVGAVVLTLGSRGAMALVSSCEKGSSKRTFLHQPLVKPPESSSFSIVDTTGAGDAFNAGFLAAWRGLVPTIASASDPTAVLNAEAAVQLGLRWGVACGTACCGRLGASVPMPLGEVQLHT